MIFTTQKAARERIEGLEASITEKDSTIAELTANLASLQNVGQEFATFKAEMEVTLENLRAELLENKLASEAYANTITDLESKLAESGKAAAAKAAEMLASAGQPETVPDGGGAPATNHLDKFNSLTGAEASEYYRKHEADIIRQQKAASKS